MDNSRFEFVFHSYANPGSPVQGRTWSVVIWAETVTKAFEWAHKALAQDISQQERGKGWLDKVWKLKDIYELVGVSSKFAQVTPHCGYGETHRIHLNGPLQNNATCQEALDLVKKYGRQP